MAQMPGQNLGGVQGQVLRRRTLLQQKDDWTKPAQLTNTVNDYVAALRRRREREPILAPIIDAEIRSIEADPAGFAARQAANIDATIAQLREYIGT